MFLIAGETRVPGGTPCWQHANSTHKGRGNRGLNPRPCCCEATVLSTSVHICKRNTIVCLDIFHKLLELQLPYVSQAHRVCNNRNFSTFCSTCTFTFLKWAVICILETAQREFKLRFTAGLKSNLSVFHCLHSLYPIDLDVCYGSFLHTTAIFMAVVCLVAAHRSRWLWLVRAFSANSVHFITIP